MTESVSESLKDKNGDSFIRAEFEQISATIKSFTAYPIISEKWGFLGRDDVLLRVEMSPIDFVAALQLQYEYTAENFAELGLYERLGDELRPASWLEVDGKLYVRIDESQRSIIFSDGNDLLFPMTRSALDYAVERPPSDSTHAPATLFVVESPDAVNVMQRLRLPAVACNGLDALDGDDVSKLFNGDLRSDLGWRYYLLLLDFDVARLVNQPQTSIHDVINRLADAEQVCHVDPSRRFGVCRPTAGDFQLLERTITFQNPAQIRQVFENFSTAAQNVKIASWRSHVPLEAPSLSAARADLIQALEHYTGSHHQIEVRAALTAYRAALQNGLIQKFYDAIDRAVDPFDQVSLLAAVNSAEAFIESDPWVRQAEAVLAGQVPPSTRELWEGSLPLRERSMQAFMRIYRDRKGKR